MYVLAFVLAIFFTVLSTAIMSYLAMAVPIGPWIEATLVLIGTIICRSILRQSLYQMVTPLLLAVAAGGIGGIIATACAFSFPTLFFLDPILFDRWFSQPLYFSAIMGGLVLAAGSLAMIIAQILEGPLLEEQKLPFAIGELVYKMITAQQNITRAGELAIGFIATFLFGILQELRVNARFFIPKSTLLVAQRIYGFFTLPPLLVRFDVLPLLLAIGFITGHLIAVPLALGALFKIAIIEPLNKAFFAPVLANDFILAFCSGMIVYGALISFLELPRYVSFIMQPSRWYTQSVGTIFFTLAKKVTYIEYIGAFISIFGFLTYMQFAPSVQCYLILGTALCTYQLSVIAGKMGIAPLGRFATFIMVPGIFLFGNDPVQATLIAAFVEICGGAATDILFGRRAARFAAIPMQTIKRYQWLGIIVSALSIGAIFWLLIAHFGLGSSHLCAQKAQTRALLLHVTTFNYTVLVLGVLFGGILKYFSINPALVLGGILMPFDYSLGLILGGIIALAATDRERWVPFWSGTFAANSIWMILKTLFTIR